MKLDAFISQVLLDIDSGLKNARSVSDRKYYVGTQDNNGVRFDIAVTTTSSSETNTEGKAKVGIIEVLGAGVGAKIGSKEENSEVSRIQFTVFVPSITEGEWNENKMQLQRNSFEEI